MPRRNQSRAHRRTVIRLSLTAALVVAGVLLSIAGGDPLGLRLLFSAHADNTAQNLPFSQNWSNTGLITADDNWTGVPGITGYRGDGLTGSTGVNPQTVLAESTVEDVIANQTNPNTLITGGVAEFQITNPVVALQGSGTARAPYIQFSLNTSGFSGINVSYNLRDIDGSADNAIQPVALQFRIGSTGNFTNVPAGFVADATDGPSLATKVTPVSATLPATADNQPLVQVRVITTDAAGSDEWVGIDDINVTGSVTDPAPFVSSTIPTNNATNVLANSNISITFSENVNVTGNWFQIACNASGTRQVSDTTVTGGPTTFAINPNNDFAANEQCTVTVFAAQVTDQDASDPPDNMTANATFAFTVAGAPADPGTVAISQVYGGGGNSGATFKNDFIELINRTGSSINLSGWSVQYASAAGSSWQVTPLSGTLNAGQYYLIQEAAGAGGTVDIDEDATGTINMAGTAGKVALVSNTTPLTDACPSDSSIIDFVGFGATASCFEGSGPTPAPSNTTAILRENNGCADTDDNSEDFTAGAPNPRNTSSPFNSCAILSGVGSANPPSVQPGDSSTLTVTVSPGSNPTSTGITVVANLSAIGGSPSQSFAGNGNSFSFLATVAVSTTPGQKSLPVTITDAQSRTANTTITLTVLQPPPPANHVVISQIYGGGGNTSATYANDFVELFNPGTVPFDLTGWSLQYASFNGSGWGSNKQPLGGTISPGEYYLVKLASGGATGAALPPANVEGEINMSASTGKVALVSSFQPLVGTCPLADPNLVDFVGYGSSASTPGFCYEGTGNAPGGSNTSSVLRKNGGNTDTNNNGNDFVTGAPNPRRTAPIVELGPNVLTTDPSSNGFNIPHDASMTITFTEPVDVVGSWYNISCANTGLHNDATVAHSANFKTYVITPNVNFQFGEQCTVTIVKDGIHDQDTDDSGPNTDTLPSDYFWTFSVVGAGAPAPYPPSVHLTMGNPSNATPFASDPDNYLMEKPTYSLSYNQDKGTPNWVSWHLEPAWFGNLTRFDTFRPDPAVLPEWYRVQATDYSGTGFDRGHMTPNADRDNENRIPINQETYLMSNMVPQAPDNNQGPWANLENDLRSMLSLNGGQEMYIVSGPLGVGGSGSNGGTTNTIAAGHVTVPAFTWKVVLVLPKGDDDVSRVTAATQTIAVMMPNTQGIRNNDWHQYLTTVDAVEQATGYDFFSNVPDAIENSIEAGTNGDNPPGTEGQSATTAEDTSKSITLTAVSPIPNASFTFTIVTPPAHGTLSGTGANRSYQPDPDFNGTDSFTFKANDGAHDSNTSTVNLTVTDVNDSPVATDDSKSTDEDVTLQFNASDLSANDSAGPANENVQTLTVTSVSSTADTHGTVSLSSGVVSYSPDQNYNGPASFTYQVCDNGTTGGASDPKCTSGTVNVTVNPVNDAPSLNAIAGQTVYLGNTLSFTAVGSDIDLPAQTLSYSLTGTVPSGASINASSGAFSWTPTAGQTGHVYTLTVRVTDNGDPALYAERQFTVGVAYTWSNLLAPVQAGGVYKGGRTIPIKFQLTGASAGVTDAVVQLLLFKVNDSAVGDPVDVESTSAATTGNLFHYENGQYVFNLNTAGMTAGTYQLQIDMGDGVLRAVNISLR
ncbi:MAG TPA: DNA/RNA non-specific endonuclease [Pyrinomonadaceae bacterium]|nr:DNA/RNA non-specific endonuclease [Pyrinomonadaceae bacterium]